MLLPFIGDSDKFFLDNCVMLKQIVNKLRTAFSSNAVKSSYLKVNLTYSVKNMKIGTHDGTFHCDEVLACCMLKMLPEYKDAEIVRTRQTEKLNECDIVIDVGAAFDHHKKRYDHHQREFNETLSSLRPELGDKYKIKLSSAGLVYTYYGEQVIKTLEPEDAPLSNTNLKIIYKKVYENLIEEIDAIDNGVLISEDEPKYRINTHLSARVTRLMPQWNNTETINIDNVFKKAMDLVKEEFLYAINSSITVWLPARDLVKSFIETRFKVHKSGQILEFKQMVPWNQHLFDLEEEMGIEGEIKFVLFKDNKKSWRVQAVPVHPLSFVLRKPLNEKWWGIRTEKLSAESGIDGCIFCHSTGFIGGNETMDGAYQMAVASLDPEVK